MRELSKKQRFERAGRRAETLIVWYLRIRAYQILARRFKTKAGEVDIIAKRGSVIAFIEVKQRASLEAAHDSISAPSQRRIMQAAENFMTKNPSHFGADIRFDAAFVIGRWKVTYFRDAFRSY